MSKKREKLDNDILNSLFEKIPEVSFDRNNLPSRCMRNDCQNINNLDITVVIPTFCRLECLERAISSLQNQTDEMPFAILVICDDPVHNEIDEYILGLQMDNIVYYKNKQNLGVFGNWNLGVYLAQTPWVTVLCDDDYLYKDYVSNIRRIMRDNPSGKYFTAFYDVAKGTSFSEITHEMSCLEKQYFLKIENRNRRCYKLDMSDWVLDESLYKIPLGDCYEKDVFLKIGAMQERFFPAGDCALVIRYLEETDAVYFYNSKVGCVASGINESAKPENIKKSREQVAAMRICTLEQSQLKWKRLLSVGIIKSALDNKELSMYGKVIREIYKKMYLLMLDIKHIKKWRD